MSLDQAARLLIRTALVTAAIGVVVCAALYFTLPA